MVDLSTYFKLDNKYTYFKDRSFVAHKLIDFSHKALKDKKRKTIFIKILNGTKQKSDIQFYAFL